MGIRIDKSPTPNPAIARPATKRPMPVDAVCIATPIQNTRAANCIPNFLPMISATGAPRRAPKKVPADRIETTRDCREEVMVHGAVALEAAEPKVQSQSFIPMMPLITPVSYPKRIPPNAAKEV
jgi:hypothetical protein